MITAGRFLVPDWSVKGTATKTTSPGSKLVVGGIVRIVPDALKHWIGHRRHRCPQAAPGAPLVQKVDEVIDFFNLFFRQFTDFFHKFGFINCFTGHGGLLCGYCLNNRPSWNPVVVLSTVPYPVLGLPKWAGPVIGKRPLGYWAPFF